jgi:phospholipase/carboxylesterase
MAALDPRVGMPDSAPMRGPALPLLLVLGAGCATSPSRVRLDAGPPAATVRLTARPAEVTTPLLPGLHPLGLSPGRDGLLYVPAAATQGPVPLLVMLHGAGSSAQNAWEVVRREAEDRGLAVLLPESRAWSWDYRHGDFGADLRFLDAALLCAFGGVRVDPAHLVLAGFSAGGTMVLSLGASNGDLFPWILAFSPTGIDVAGVVGHPRYFIAHGTLDSLVPIGMSSRAIVPALRAQGASVVYREFEGPHVVPEFALQEALTLALD